MADAAAPASSTSAAPGAMGPLPGNELTGQTLKDAVVRFKASDLLNLLPKTAGCEAIEAGLRTTRSRSGPAGAQHRAF